MQIDRKILEMCKTAIKQRLRSLDDLPDELANTVANIFYRSFELSMKWTENISQKAYHHIRADMGMSSDTKIDAPDSSANIKAYYDKTRANHKDIDDMNRALHAAANIVTMITGLRSIDKTKKPNTYRAKVDFILDVMKYGIKDPESENSIAKAIERDLREKDIKEIPHLYRYIT